MAVVLVELAKIDAEVAVLPVSSVGDMLSVIAVRFGPATRGVASEAYACICYSGDFAAFLICDVAMEIILVARSLVICCQEIIPLFNRYRHGYFGNYALVPDV